MTGKLCWAGTSHLCSPMQPSRQAPPTVSVSRRLLARPTLFQKVRCAACGRSLSLLPYYTLSASHPQLEELKAAGAARVEDGAVPVDKSLAEILAENKAKEEAEFKAKLDLMKQGVCFNHATTDTRECAAAAAPWFLVGHCALATPTTHNNAGKNRPLDEDEADFLGSVVQQAAEVERAVRMAEQQELAAFREVCACFQHTWGTCSVRHGI